MHIAILGFSREGKSTLKFLKTSRKFRGAKIEILDQVQSKNYLRNLKRFNLIFRSPGIPYSHPKLVDARCNGVKLSSATVLFFESASRRTANIIGITGSKGKGTTATLLYRILKAAGKNVHLAGNIGLSPLAILPKLTKKSFVVLELSSFQLQDLPYSPHIAVVLDMFPEHLDHHKSVREYYGAKANIARWQKPSDSVFYFSDNPKSRRIATKGKGKRIKVHTRGFTLFKEDDLKIKGAHNFKNAIMAAMVARHLGVPEAIIASVTKQFQGMEHRLEFARTIDKVRFYNDSASTNPHTAVAAIRAFPNEPIILIAGGSDKGLDYRPLAQALRGSSVRTVVLFGENKDKIMKAIRSSGIPIKLVSNLNTALQTAYRSAKLLPTTHYSLVPVVLFSPGAASFDMFKNYADRGMQFKKIVKSFKTR